MNPIQVYHRLIHWLDRWGERYPIPVYLYNRRIVVARWLFFGIILSAVLLLLGNADNSAILVLQGAAIASFLLIGRGYFLLARWVVWSALFLVFALYYPQLVFTNAAFWSGQLLYLSFTFIPVVFFDLKERISLGITSVLGLALFIAYPWLVSVLTTKDLSMFGAYSPVFITNCIAALIILLPGILFLVSENNRALAVNQKLRRVAEERQAELEANLNTIRLQEQDIAERKVMEEQLRAAKKQAEQAYSDLQMARNQMALSEKLALLGELVAGIVHEINNPIGAIRSQVATLMATWPHVVSGLRNHLSALDPAAKEAFEAVLIQADAKAPVRSTREVRELRRNLQQALEQQGVGGAEEKARLLLDANLPDLTPAVSALLQSPRGEESLLFIKSIRANQEGLHTIGQSIDRTANILQAVKRYAHNTDESVRNAAVNIQDNINTIVVLFSYQIRKSATLELELAPGAEVWANSDKLSQVWTNLITNALQAMEGRTGGILRIESVVQGGAVAVRITDNGHGIAPDVLPRIFDPFFTTKPKGVGTGMGLAIIKQIVEEAGGTIAVRSRPGQTTFTVTMPLHPQAVVQA